MGESATRLRLYSFEEVQRLNAGGGCWLILDGMVSLCESEQCAKGATHAYQ
jgi:hypothetical protein